MKIDTNAPVFARKEIIIHAPLEKVWQIQSDIENWPSWQPDIVTAKLDGELKAGATFRWKADRKSVV